MSVPRGLQLYRPKRVHLEALAIVAFLLADLYLSGWSLVAATVAILAYVAIPAVRTMWTQTALERVIFLKAYVKTPRFQRTALILFWFYSMRFFLNSAVDANLFLTEHGSGSLTFIVTQVFQELFYLGGFLTPLAIYGAACALAIGMRSRLKATREDPDLIAQRQRWAGATQIVFFTAFVASVLSITLNPDGPVLWIANWLLASAADANMVNVPLSTLRSMGEVVPHQMVLDNFRNLPLVVAKPQNLAFISDFRAIVAALCSVLAGLLLFQPICKLHAFLTSFTWRVISVKSLQHIVEGFLEAMHLPARKLAFPEAHPLLGNSIRTTVWVTCCYLFLFFLFGFSDGPLGEAIKGWLDFSVTDAGFGVGGNSPAWLSQLNFRIFMASVIALLATPAFSVFCLVFVPFAKPRKISINADGINFAQGPYLTMLGRQFRLWSDLKSIEANVRPLKSKKGSDAKTKTTFTLRFRSGGFVRFNGGQMPAPDLKLLLDAVDRHAVNCIIDKAVFEACARLSEEDERKKPSDGIVSVEDCRGREEFKSTIFVPYSQGEYLPGTKVRITRQLASKPLCAVYLAREEAGRMVNVKQFYLAEDNAETRAFTKILKREYEILTALDHPGIAKVLNCFTVGESTYLLIEHRPGKDLRELVLEQGSRSEKAVLEYASQLCQILIYMHGREPAVLHRDLTPDNVIVGEDGQLRLIDFGAAREFIEGVTGTMIGKQTYVSPEQLRGEADCRSDIYSFGCLLHFLLTGRDPVALSTSSPSSFIECSEALDALVRECTAFDADERPRSFKEILSRLNAMDKGFKLNIKSSLEAVTGK